MSHDATIFDLCIPRDDVLTGKTLDGGFAADLAQVIRGEAPPAYADPTLFFANSHPTRGLKNLLANVAGRLSGGPAAAAVFRLDTSFGGGKTHGLIALVHAANGMAGVANPSEFLDPSLLPRVPVRVAAFDGENADPANGRRMGPDGALAFTPWGEIAYALAGPDGYRRVEASDRSGTAPGAGTIAELFGSGPALILLDELAVYLRKVWRQPNARDQLTAFLTALFKAVESSPGAALVYTLALGTDGSSGDAYSDENRFVADRMAEARSVSARKATLLNPTEDDETVDVLRRRLFARVDRAAATAVVASYRDVWARNREMLSLEAAKPETAASFDTSYPFHPEVLETLTSKTATLADFQRVRGMLRILARTVAKLWQDRPADATAIHLHHIDPGFGPIQQEVTTRLGQGMYVPALRSDVAGEGTTLSLAQQVDAASHAGLPPYAAYVARTVFVHSLAYNDALKGITPERLRYSVAGPRCEVAFIEGARQAFRAQSAYLDDRPGAPMRFLVEANLTQLIRREEQGVDPQSVRDQLTALVRDLFKGAPAVFDLVFHPAGPWDVPDEAGDGRPLLVLMSPDACAVGATVDAVPDLVGQIWHGKGADGRTLRTLRNNLVFLLADDAETGPMRAAMARRIALAQLKAGHRLRELAEHQRIELQSREARSAQEVAVAIQRAFRHLFYPSASPVAGSPVPLAHLVLPIPSTSERPGSGQTAIVRELRAAGKLRTGDDEPDEPRFVRDKTPLRLGQITTAALRREFRENHRLPMLSGDEVFRKGIRLGVDRGEFIYQRGDLLYGQGDPMASIALDEDAVVFTMNYATAQAIWPRKPPPGPSADGPAAPGTGWNAPPPQPGDLNDSARAMPFSAAAPHTTTRPPPPAPLHAEGPLRAALTELFDKAQSRKVAAFARLTVQALEAGDGFKLLAAAGAIRGAAIRASIVGEYETAAGSSLTISFEGTPADAAPLKEFLDPQLRAAAERDLKVTLTMSFNEGLPTAGDAPAKLSDQLTRFATGAAYVEASADPQP